VLRELKVQYKVHKETLGIREHKGLKELKERHKEPKVQ
jgi:hypothetical protein